MPYDFESVKSSLAYADALAKGCQVVVPLPNELFIDIDSPEQRHWFSFNLSKLEMHCGAEVIRETASPSGEPDHVHIVVRVNRELGNMERILLQSILGSDPQREAFSWIRLISGDDTPTLFFEKGVPLLTVGYEEEIQGHPI